jgi:hypothetical protein
MREEADCSGLVNGEGVRSGMLSSLARMGLSFQGRRGRLVSPIKGALTEGDARNTDPKPTTRGALQEHSIPSRIESPAVGLLEGPAMKTEKPPDDKNSRDEVLARYERGIMTLLFILAAAAAALIIWLGWVFLSWVE